MEIEDLLQETRRRRVRADVGIGPYKTLCSQSIGVDAHIDPCRESGLFAGLRMFRKTVCTIALRQYAA